MWDKGHSSEEGELLMLKFFCFIQKWNETEPQQIQQPLHRV